MPDHPPLGTTPYGTTIGIRGLAYYVGASVPIEELSCMANDRALLQRFKAARFKNFSRSSVSLADQAILAAQETLRRSGLAAADIDAIVIGASELNPWDGFPEGLSTAILRGLGMNHLPVVGVTLAGCANAASSLRMARNMIAVDGYRSVMVIETNQHRDDTARLVGTAPDDAPCSVFGDGAVSFVATSAAAQFEVLAMEQLVCIHQDADASKHDAIAKNVASSRHVVARALQRAGLSHDQIHCALFGNINFKMLLGMRNALGLSGADFFTDNIYRHGHVWSADVLINLHDYCEKRAAPAGALFLLVAQGSSYYSAVICRKNF
jgi:3-oxoacyl-[acyl-carrier-protein] synthase III